MASTTSSRKGIETIIIGGPTIIRGEKRFVPLQAIRRRIRHCRSCAKFRKRYNGYCASNPNIFTNEKTTACNDFINRTWRNQ